MGNNSTEPTYTGIDKYPGIISTVVTIIILVIFVGALYMSASHHDDSHGDATQSEEQH